MKKLRGLIILDVRLNDRVLKNCGVFNLEKIVAKNGKRGCALPCWSLIGSKLLKLSFYILDAALITTLASLNIYMARRATN